MDEHWLLDRLEIRGGFLEAVDLTFPPGLTCIIGPRGSGKSTLAEALRCGMAGLDGASKARLDIFKANLARSAITIRTKPRADGVSYVIRRDGRHPAVVTTSEGKSLAALDLDRGTFLPLDGYSSFEIEQIADENLGIRRRQLLDELRPREFTELSDRLVAARRALEGNSDAVRSTRRTLADVIEQIQALAHARERLSGLPSTPASNLEAVALQSATRQQQMNEQEAGRLRALLASLSQAATRISTIAELGTTEPRSATAPSLSKNQAIVDEAERAATTLLEGLRAQAAVMLGDVQRSSEQISSLGETLAQAHRDQAAHLAELRERNQAAGQAARERSEAELGVQRLEQLEKQRAEAGDRVDGLLRQC